MAVGKKIARSAVGLLAPCEVRWVSDEIGYGLFAKAHIPKGTLLWQYSRKSVKEYTWLEFQRYMASSAPVSKKVRLLKTAYGWRGKLVVPLDDSVFLNHSRSGNCFTGGGESGNDTVASRDIPRGEELLDNYLEYEYPDWLIALHAEYHIDKSYLHKA